MLLEACFGALVFYAHGHRERLGVAVGVGVRARSRGKGRGRGKGSSPNPIPYPILTRGVLASKTSPPKPKRVPSAEELRAAVLLQAHLSTPTQPPNPDPNPYPSP